MATAIAPKALAPRGKREAADKIETLLRAMTDYYGRQGWGEREQKDAMQEFEKFFRVEYRGKEAEKIAQVVDFLSTLSEPAANAFLPNVRKIQSDGARRMLILMSEEVMRDDVAAFASRLTKNCKGEFETFFGGPAFGYFDAIWTKEKGREILTSETVMRDDVADFVIKAEAGSWYFNALASGKFTDFLTSKGFVNERTVEAIKSLGKGLHLSEIEPEPMVKILTEQIVFSRALLEQSRLGFPVSRIFAEPPQNGEPQLSGRVRSSRYENSVQQCARSRLSWLSTHPSLAPPYSGCGYLNAMLGSELGMPPYFFSGMREDITNEERRLYVPAKVRLEIEAYREVMAWLETNRKDLHEEVIALSKELIRLSQQQDGGSVTARFQVIFPDNTREIAEHRLQPSAATALSFAQGVSSSFKAASHYAVSLLAFDKLLDEIRKPSPEKKELEDLVRRTRGILLQQQGLGFAEPPLHGGARGEEPPEWDADNPRSFKATRNVFQKLSTPVLESFATGWRKAFDFEEKRERSVKVTVPAEQANELDEVAYYKTVKRLATFYINSTEYSITDENHDLTLMVHQFSDFPKEVALGNAGIAVELELGGKRRFLDGAEFKALAEKLEKRTLASLLLAGELA